MAQRNLEFRDSQATLQVKESGEVYIQALDAYGFQRELIITPVAGHSDASTGYTIHVYQHPGRREIITVPRDAGGRFISRLLDTVERYPTLLFNPPNDTYGFARSRGFVYLCESLFRGDPIKNLLK